MSESCPFCNSSNIILKRKIKSPINKVIYKNWVCKNCGLEFFTPLKFENVYSSEKINAYVDFHRGRENIPEWTKEVIRVIKNLDIDLKNKRILEIGAGDCINFLAFKKYFKITEDNYYAIELDNKSVEICKRRNVKNIIVGFFNSKILDLIGKKFDVILCLEVLEHQINPKEFFDTCFKLLRKGGIIIITVPNREMSLHRWKEIPGDIPPHHFLRFNKRFFIKNFNRKVMIVKTYRMKNKTLKKTSEILSKKIFKSKKLYFLFFPIAFIIRILDIIKPEGLLVIIKND